MSINFEKDLNKQQFAAVTSTAKHLRIVAGAGTGKTRVLTYRLAYLISERHIAPKRIVAITFTNKVAAEMKERVYNLLTDSERMLGSPLISTFHGFCYRFLSREITHMQGFTNKFQIADDDVQNDIFKSFAEKLGYKMKSPYMSLLVGTIRNLKTKGVFVDQISNSDVPLAAPFTFKVLEEVYSGYQEKLKQSNLLDFDDLLMFTLRILKENENVRRQWQSIYSVFLVDEFQDTNQVQYDIVKILMNNETELAVVGDPDQTIYTWRGADNNLVRYQLEKDFKDLETITLDENYRSTQAILDKANLLIKNNSNRMEKNLVAANKEVGDKVECLRANNAEEEARMIATKIYGYHKNGIKYSDCAIIYRSNYLSRAIEQALSQAGIPYRLYGSLKFYERAEIKDALSYFRLLVNPDDAFSFARILKAPAKGIAEKGALEINRVCEKYGVNILDSIDEHLDEIHLGSKPKLCLKQFIEAYKNCLKYLEKNDDLNLVSTILTNYLDSVGFLDYVKEIDRKNEDKSDDKNSNSKFDNVMELMSFVNTFMLSPSNEEEGLEPTLEDFLILVAIQSSQDEVDSNADAVSVMTAHISKGLEFPCVFVTGVNQFIFPSSHAINEGTKVAIEEERRLMYVAMTRAKKHLAVSYFGGYNFSQGSNNIPSIFLKEAGLLQKNSISNGYSISSPKTTGGYFKNASNEYNRIQKILNKNYASQQKEEEYQGRRGIINSNPNIGTKDHYEIGDKCVHTSYGIGTVTAINGDRLTVDFGEKGTKMLMNGFKAFKKLNNNK